MPTDWIGETFADLLPSLPALFESEFDKYCVINYDEQYKLAIKLLMALQQLDRESDCQRTLLLTDYILSECEGHYTAWTIRRQCIKSLQELESEMKWIEAYTVDCPKNYQLWQHRMQIFKSVMVRLAGPGIEGDRVSKELDSVFQELDRNPKNYHAWQYRAWLLLTYPIADLSVEVNNCSRMLQKDPLNNSARNHLCFLREHFGLSLDMSVNTL
jgi:protein farnesyltransferase/geranylgeranyltransferase type-1 subunit alpha